MTAWGVVAACGMGGLVAGPLLDAAARRARGPAARVATTAVAPDDAIAVVAGRVGPLPAAGTGDTAGSPADVTLRQPTLEVPARLESAVAGVVTGGLFALAAVRVGSAPQLAAYCAFFAGLVAVSITDLRTGIVPRVLLYPASALVVAGLVAASAADGSWHRLLDALIGAAVAFGVLGAVWWVYPRGLGFGDVRLAALCGGALGWLGFPQVYLGFLAAFVVGAGIGIGVLAVSQTRRFPFAPALAAGAAFGVLWGGWLGNLWLHPG